MPKFVRLLTSEVQSAATGFGAVVISGPRRSGKTFLLRHAFPKASFHLLEDPDVLAQVKADPRGWLDSVKLPAIIDEIQNAPELLPYIRSRIDRSSKKGQWLLTGSQDFSLMHGVSESMAGRAAVFHLLPLSLPELGSWNLIRGSYPEVVLRPRQASLWFRSYVQTYLERDVRSIAQVRDLAVFRRFLSIVASRVGQILNKTDIGAPLGVSVPTVTSWLSILETTGVILLVPPFFENFSKRLVKSPRLYWVDSGLLCHFLGLDTRAELEKSPFCGAVFESFVAAELTKRQLNAGQARAVYHFRDEQGLEVDFLVPRSGGRLELVEAKWSKTILPAMAAPMIKLRAAIRHHKVSSTIVHPAALAQTGTQTVAPEVKAVTVGAYFGNHKTLKR